MEELDIRGFKNFMIEDGLADNTANSYASNINRVLEILSEMPRYENLSSLEKIERFSQEDNTIREEFNRHHDFNEDTFSDTRSASKKYIDFKNSGVKIPPKINKNILKMNTKNIILYGPPGVGKTYNHKKLISLIEEGVEQKEIFDAIKENDLEADERLFESVKEEGRFKFVTFHQSYSYEDFIEGFRPNEDGTIKLEDGIFKEIADEARKNLDKSDKTEHILDFENILEQFQLENEIGTILKIVQGKEFEIVNYTAKSIQI